MPKVYKPQPSNSGVRRFIASVNSVSWLWGLIWAVIGWGVVQFQLHEQSKTVFDAECSLSGGEPISFELTASNEATIWLGIRCAVRNKGFRQADVVEVRTALLDEGKLPYSPEPTVRDFERVRDVKVNGELFTRPVTVQPGSQATVDVWVKWMVHREPSPKLFDALLSCDRNKELRGAHSLDMCLGGVAWTDHLRGAGRKGYTFYDSYSNGIGGLFLLSSGSSIVGEVRFRSWGWSCSRPDLSPIPSYMSGLTKELCSPHERSLTPKLTTP